MSEHTPGPWRSFEARGENQIAFTRDGNHPSHYRIGIVATSAKWLPKHAEANARLIAAAPDLLAACQHVVEMLGAPEGEFGACVNFEMLRAAIAKAEGR